MTIFRERKEMVQASEVVKCGICGKFFNKRYVSSHMRLAHPKKSKPGSSARNEAEIMEEILHLYESLPDERRKELRNRLKSPASAS